MTTEPTTASSRRWIRRCATVAVCWAIAWPLTAWLNMHPDPPGLLGAIAAFFAACWLVADRGAAWDPVAWDSTPVGRRLRSGTDTRIGHLSRLMRDAEQVKPRGEVNPSAIALQSILRDVTLDRLRRRAASSGALRLPSDEELLAAADPKFGAYFAAQPAPPTSRQTVTDIINRIEAL